ncbi:MAG: GNAT family N-acetyltransferase [Lachnospiraceae bacterium]|nr:GNAT family N-acetyltransferase [Lachnospiraceae bacterium]
MWYIKHIFDGDYGCEERSGSSDEAMVSVTLVSDGGEEKLEVVADSWLRKNNLDVGAEWPDYSDLRLETENLLLRKACRADWKDMYENLWRHDESARYMLWEPTHSEADAVIRAEKSEVFQRYHKYTFFIQEKESGKVIGFAGMKEIEPGICEDTGIAIGPSFVGHGYGTQVLKALLAAAKEAGAVKFVYSARIANEPSRKLAKRCGFVVTGTDSRVDPRDNSTYVLEFSEKDL